ncbi:hypothetical protein [Nostoc sp.]|uniref:hypothetical protein n=1 Tax=Nostoc sp. TaxID=1180 RepID=UPI002FFC37AD
MMQAGVWLTCTKSRIIDRISLYLVNKKLYTILWLAIKTFSNKNYMLYLEIEFLPIIIYVIPSLILRLCMLVLYVLLQVVWCDRTPSSPGSDRTPHSITLESKMLRIAYERYYNHFPFYTQIEN